MNFLIMRQSCIRICSTSLQLLGILLIVVFLINSYTIVHAQTTDNQPNFTLQPVTYNSKVPATRSYFILDTKPGTTIMESIRVTNAGHTAGKVSIYPVSAITAQTSGISYLTKKDPLHDVAAWITMDRQQLTLAPYQSQDISFRIAIPRLARPGQHLGAIVAENMTLQTVSAKGALHINIQNINIMAVQVNIPGPALEQMKVTDIKAGGSNGYQSMLVSMINTGNTMISSSGSMSIKNSQGKLLQVLPFKSGLILPDTSINFPVSIQKALSAGDYQIALILSYGHGKTLTYTTNLTITQNQVNQAFSNGPLQAPTSNSMPLWQIILVILAAIIVLFVAGQKAYHILNTYRRKQARSTTEQEDNTNNTRTPSTKKHKAA